MPAPTDATLARWRVCALDPWVFALTYLPHHVRLDGVASMSDLHRELRDLGRRWALEGGPSREPAADRSAWIAPRENGKSTWVFLILPLWAAAFGYVKFAAAFADSGPQAENHLTTFKHELDTNELLRYDFPSLCRARKRLSGVNEADRHGLYVAESGFVFAARGIDASSLGLKIGAQRPDLIILDDIEPDESSYSDYQMRKRRATLLDAVLPLNIYARVLMVGTVTMPGSIIHQAVRWARGDRDDPKKEEGNGWMASARFRVVHIPAIAVSPDGTERSTWPEKWSLAFLQSIRNTRSYLKNYANDPLGADGGYWTKDDFRYGRLEVVTRTLLSVDPGVTTRVTSDPAGLAVVGWQPPEPRVVPKPGRCQVEAAYSVRLTGAALRDHVLTKVLPRFPHIGLILVEVNQGGDLWYEVFHDMPVKVRAITQSAKKEVRAGWVLDHYQRGRVWHTEKLPQAEEQMVSFPRAPHDDIVDAIGTGVTRFLNPPAVRRAGAETLAYG